MSQPRESSDCQEKTNTGFGGQGPPHVLVCDGEGGPGASEIFTEKLSVSGTQVQTAAAYSPWQKFRVEQRIATIEEVAGKTILKHQVELSATRLPTQQHEFFGQRMKVYGELMEHGEVVHHPTVVDEGDELASRFIIRASAREALEENAASEAIRRAAAARFRPLKFFEPVTFCFFYRHHPGKRPQTAIRGRCLGLAAFIGPHWSKQLVGAVWWKGISVRH